MTKEELRNKAENIAITEARNYKTVYSEDFKLKEVLNDPLRFDQDFSERLYLLMKEKHYRDGFSDGYITGATAICKKILEEVRTNEGIEQITKFYIGEIVKNLGVDIDE